MSDPFIQSLVDDMSEVKPLANKKLYGMTLTLLVLGSCLVLSLLGLRPDFFEFIKTLPAVFKNGTFLMLFAWAAWLTLKLSRPSTHISVKHFVPALLVPAGLTVTAFAEPSKFSIAAFEGKILGMTSMGFHCSTTLMIGGLITFGFLWKAWLKHTASSQPALLGLTAGVASGSLTAFAYAFHCSSDYALYVSVYYGIPIVMLAIIGGLVGRRKLVW